MISLTIPIRTVSESNVSEHWTKKSKRHKKQKKMVAYFLNIHKKKISLPCTIKLTRCAPNKLDKFDNLPMSFKYILDAICEVITGNYVAGRADNEIEDEIDVIYRQIVQKTYEIRIEIY